MEGCRYEELEHTSEIGVRAHAASPALLYACAARAMFALLQARPAALIPGITHRIVVDSTDADCLMVDWLGELLFLHETAGFVLADCQVDEWSPTRIEATVTGNLPAEPPALHIKAVTFHQLSVAQTDAGWTAVVFFDI